MKVRIKFEKRGNLRFIGHLDLMRYFQKANRRADLPIAYSEGFSPHQIMSFAAPLSMGVESTAEYADFKLTDEAQITSEEAVLRMNREMFDFIQYLRKPDRRPAERMSFDCVTVLGAYSTQEAQDMLEYYRMKGYVFLNYTAQDRATGPYAEYEEDFDQRHIFGQEFDRAVALMDDSFCYDAEGELSGVPIPDPDNLYPNLFYHAVTRVREQLVLIIVRAPGLLDRILSIFEGKSDETSADDVQ